MTSAEAAAILADGRFVRRSVWPPAYFVERRVIEGGPTPTIDILHGSVLTPYSVDLDATDATDWEEYTP